MSGYDANITVVPKPSMPAFTIVEKPSQPSRTIVPKPYAINYTALLAQDSVELLAEDGGVLFTEFN